jgi:hypothetical protein
MGKLKIQRGGNCLSDSRLFHFFYQNKDAIALMKKLIFSLFLISGWMLTAKAQMTSDAYMFSEKFQPTTARAAGVGGAMGALGGDMSTLNLNPAGIAVYRGFEFVFTPGLQFADIKSTFVSDSLQPMETNSRTAFNLGSLGLIFATDYENDWDYVNFGISYNRLASFNKTFSFSGISTGSRILNFTEEANNSNAIPDKLDPFEERLAWDAYLIDNPGGGTQYVGAASDSMYVQKSQFVRQSGGNNELGISVGASYKSKFFIGATIGIDFLNFRDNRDYSEQELTGNTDFKSMQFKEEREVTGTGVNLKLGIIYKINKTFRMGLAVHTPTASAITERLTTSLSGSVVWNDTLRVTSESDPFLSPTGEFKHNFISPWFFNFSLGAVFKGRAETTKGFLCLEGDYLNYSLANFTLSSMNSSVTSADRAYISNVNKAIINQYQGVFRGRLGFELALDKVRFRAGYRIQTSPYQKEIKGVSDLRHDISLGFGIRTDHFYVDLAYMHTINDFEYSPFYATSEMNNQRTVNDWTGGLILLTFGVRF